MAAAVHKILSTSVLYLLGMRMPCAASMIANLIPLAGVAWLGWSINEIFMIYIIETVIITFFAIIKSFCLLCINKTFLHDIYDIRSPLSMFVADFFSLFKQPLAAVAVFSVSLCALTYSLLFSCLMLFDPAYGAGGTLEPIQYICISMKENIVIGGTAFFICHSISFVADFILRGEYRRVHPFVQPLGKISMLFIIILVGIELNKRYFHSTTTFLVVMIAVKMLADAGRYMRAGKAVY